MPASSFSFPTAGFPTATVVLWAPSWLPIATPAFPRYGYPGPYQDEVSSVASGSRVNIWSNAFTGDGYLHNLMYRGAAVSTGTASWGSIAYGGGSIFLNFPWEVGVEMITSGGSSYTAKPDTGLSFIFGRRPLLDRSSSSNANSTNLRNDGWLRCTFRPEATSTGSRNVVCEIAYRSTRTGVTTTLATQTTSGATASWGDNKTHEFRVTFDPGDSNKIRMYSNGIQPGAGAGFEMTSHLLDYAFAGAFEPIAEAFPFLGWSSTSAGSVQACRVSAWGVAGLLGTLRMPNYGPPGAGAIAATEDSTLGAYFPGDSGAPLIVIPGTDIISNFDLALMEKYSDPGSPVGTGSGVIIAPPSGTTFGQLYPQGNS